MNKRSFFFLALIVILVFACDLQMPEEIQIKKETPELHIAANTDDFSLEDLFDLDFDFDYGSDPNVAVLDCVKVPILTKLIYIKLFDEDIETSITGDSEIMALIGASTPIPLDFPLLHGSPVTINAPYFDDTLLESFKLNPLKSRLHISGSNPDFIDILLIELDINGDTKPYGRSKECVISASEFISEEYLGTYLPPGGNDFELPFDNDLTININLSIKGGSIITPSMLHDMDILVELAVWLPFELTVIEPGGFEMDLPFNDLFSEGDDLLGRDSGDEDSKIFDAIENLYLEIVFNENPFSDAILSVTSPGSITKINSVMQGNSIKINVNKDMIGYPFLPGFSIKLEEDKRLSVPRVFKIEKLAFKAQLKFVIEL